jgi:hypothetical protein
MVETKYLLEILRIVYNNMIKIPYEPTEKEVKQLL